MSDHRPAEDVHQVRIRVKGYLNSEWSEWLESCAVLHEADGATRLEGRLPDQPALFGLLMKIRDLGLELLSVEWIPVRMSKRGRD